MVFNLVDDILNRGRSKGHSYLSLHTKFIGLITLVTLVTAISISAISFNQVMRNERQLSLKRLRFEASLHETRLLSRFEEMDILEKSFARWTLPRTLVGADDISDPENPFYGTPSEGLDNQFEAALVVSMRRRPYMQKISVLALNNGLWIEVTGAEFVDGTLRRLRDSGLKSGSELEDTIVESKVFSERGYYTEIFMDSVDGGKERVPVFRRFLPIFSGSGELKGAFVVTYNFLKVVSMLDYSVSSGASLEFVTNKLDSIEIGRNGENSYTNFHQSEDYVEPVYASLFEDSENFNKPVIFNDQSLFIDPILEAIPERPFGIYSVAQTPVSLIGEGSSENLTLTLTMTAVMTVIMTLVSALLGRVLTRPLRQLTDTIRSHTGHRSAIDLDVQSNDEIGELAEAFVELANDLLEETLRSHAMFKEAVDGIIVVDEKGIIEEVNPAALALFGYEESKLLGLCIDTILTEAAVETEQDEETLLSAIEKMTGQKEKYGRCKDGREIPLEITVSENNEKMGGRSIIIMRDMSARKAVNEKMKALISSLEKSNQELDTFAYVASHDLKAPLRVIDNASRWLEEDLEDVLTEDTRESLDMLRSRVKRMEQLLDDLLEHSRIGRDDEVKRIVQGTELKSYIEELVNLPLGMVLDFGYEFEDIELPYMPISSVLVNLIGNSIKHHDKKTGHIFVDAQITPSGDYMFIVEDDGPGVPPEYHEKIFEMFKTLKPRDQVDGSGMGLAMVRKYLDLAGGHAEVVSDGQRGTVFRIYWPKEADLKPTQWKAA